ncbi:MAG: terminase large subunit [Acholeplasmataceae bacterium]
MRNNIDLEHNTINGIHSYFLEYYNKVFNQGWIAGHKLKQVMKKQLEYLENWDYDQRYAHMRIDFQQKYCKQSKNRFSGKPLQLMKWQKALYEVVYSFKYPDSTRRKYNEVLVVLARKNGKSTMIAGDINTDLFLANTGDDIACASNNDDQAALVFDEVNNMRERMDPRGQYTHKNRKGIFNVKTKSRVFKMSDKSKTKDGNNLVKACIDEIHEMKTDDLYYTIQQSMSIVENPLIWEITTEGTLIDGRLDKRMSYADKVLKEEIEDDNFLPWIYQQDDSEEIFVDPMTWWKSNPSLNVIKQYTALEKNINKARVSREDRAFILCKDFNIKQNKALSWLLIEEITNTETFDLEEFRGATYIAGIDLSETTDLTTVSIEIKKNRISYFHTMYFIPAAKSRSDSDTNPEQMNYREWSRSGYVTILPGNTVTYEAITEYLWSLFENYQLKPFKIGYDQWNAKGLVKDLEYKFGTGITERIQMNYSTLTNPMRILGADLKDKKINYQNNPITLWNLSNVAIKTNSYGQIMPVKVHGSTDRIDGAVSMIICKAVEERFSSEFEYFELGGDD